MSYDELAAEILSRYKNGDSLDSIKKELGVDISIIFECLGWHDEWAANGF